MRFFSVLFLTLLIGLESFSQKYTLEAKRGVLPNNYNYWVCTPPDYTSKKVVDTLQSLDSVQKKYPLVVFLHGASLCGRDLNRVRRYGCIHAIGMGRDINAVVVAPQNPGGAWNPKKISDIMDWTKENYNVDTNRIYVLGMSLGGYGTIDFCATYPEKVAAAMALCGGSSGQGDISNLGKVPLWIIHGTADRAVGISNSKVIVSRLESENKDSLLLYTWLQGGSHGAPARLFYMQRTYDWLFSHSLNDSVRFVNKDYSVSMADLTHAYENLSRTQNRFSVVDHNTDTKTSSTASIYRSKPLNVDYSNCEVWVVKQGDVLVNIARSTKTTVENICRLNGISKNTTLRIGQKLKICEK